MYEDSYTVTIDEPHSGIRLDKALALLVPELSRSRIQQLINAGEVRADGQAVMDAKHKVSAGELYSITIPPLVEAVPKPEAIELDIIHEDDDLLVINKPAGLVVHPGAGTPDGTLVNALLHHAGDSLSGIGGVARPGIVHRLDKDTSGLMVVAKHDQAHRALAAQLEDRSLSRIYQALAWGLPSPASGTIDAPVGRDSKHRQRMCVTESGKPAITHYQLTQAFGMLVSLVECKLQTGRTHQIRVHMKHIGHPLVGDPVYGGRKAAQLKHHNTELVRCLREFPRQALHAKAIAFIHPASGEVMQFACDMPEDMEHLCQTLR